VALKKEKHGFIRIIMYRCIFWAVGIPPTGWRTVPVY